MNRTFRIVSGSLLLSLLNKRGNRIGWHINRNNWSGTTLSDTHGLPSD